MGTDGSTERTAVDEYREEVERQTREVSEIVAGLGEEQLAWRPEPEKWSVGEHVVHLIRTIPPYLVEFEEALADARERGLAAAGPFRRPWLGEWVIRTMEPPPGISIPTVKTLVPDRGLPRERIVESWRDAQDSLIASMEEARGLDLGRARIRSPFVPLLRVTADQGYRLVLAHARRHIWLVRRTMEAEGFPSG
ncbi:MAG TPA: DinB family protein [Longimicrobiales bacterium]|nr:DinB family protein [Longimicrobiales bacterium]